MKQTTPDNHVSRPIGRILVVDSDQNICEMIRGQFQAEGLDTDWCSSSRQLYNITLDEYCLIFVDLGFETGEGLNLIEQIKQTPGCDNIGVIACSNRMSPTVIISALNAGADDYILKPFSLRELKARAQALMRRC